MKKYLVSVVVVASIEVYAESQDEAIEAAKEIPFHAWEFGFYEMEDVTEVEE